MEGKSNLRNSASTYINFQLQSAVTVVGDSVDTHESEAVAIIPLRIPSGDDDDHRRRLDRRLRQAHHASSCPRKAIFFLHHPTQPNAADQPVALLLRSSSPPVTSVSHCQSSTPLSSSCNAFAQPPVRPPHSSHSFLQQRAT